MNTHNTHIEEDEMIAAGTTVTSGTVEKGSLSISRTKLKNIKLEVEIYAVVLPWLKNNHKTKKISETNRKKIVIPISIVGVNHR